MKTEKRQGRAGVVRGPERQFRCRKKSLRPRNQQSLWPILPESGQHCIWNGKSDLEKTKKRRNYRH